MRSRNWIITLWEKVIDKETGEEHINNLYEYIDELEKRYDSDMYCIHDKEQEENKHLHIYIKHSNPINFKTLHNINKYAHIEYALGNVKQIHKYLLHKDSKSIKEGKLQYEEDLIGGNITIFDDTNIFEMIENECNLYDIVKSNPELLKYTKQLKEVQEFYDAKKLKNLKKILDNDKIDIL